MRNWAVYNQLVFVVVGLVPAAPETICFNTNKGSVKGSDKPIKFCMFVN